MSNNSVLVVYYSYHHKNTETVAREMGGVLGADLLDLAEDDSGADLKDYELVGFGSGVYYGSHHKKLLEFVDGLVEMKDKKGFIFATSGLGWLPILNNFDQPLKKKLEAKKFDIIGEYYCRGYDTYSFLQLIGGIQNGHPNAKDLENARKFAEETVLNA